MNANTDAPVVLTDLTPDELARTLEIQPFQGRQIFRWIHEKGVFELDAMTDLPKALRQRLADAAAVSHLRVVQVQRSAQTGTRKALFELRDGETVEAVMIADRDRRTICLSSQVGCPLKCAFCATGLAGFTRNLSPGEIVEQALRLLADEPLGERTPNIVYMGMGEPLRNYDNVVKSIRLLMARGGLGIGARKITVSTAGEVREIERFADEDWQVRLSVSLHAANDALRSRLVPLNRRFPLERLREAVGHYITRTGRQITYEWTLLHEVNDSMQDVRELIEFIGDTKAFVNLIPWNPVADLPFAPSTPERCAAFRDALVAAGVKATLRAEKGQDIDAACGQLRRTHGA